MRNCSATRGTTPAERAGHRTVEVSVPDAAIKWFGPEIGDLEQTALAGVVAGNYLNDGPLTRRFEAALAQYLGVRHAVAVTNGTAAISLGLMAVGVGPGDEVIVPDLTFIATANAVRLAGAEVRLVDIEPRRFTLDPELVRAAIGPRTKAIVPVDVNGRGADYESLDRICAQHGLKLVCDCAEALGSRRYGRHLGSFGDAGCFSFSANKTVTSGQGGMVVTNSDDVYYRLRELKDQGRRFGGSGGDDLHPVLGFNFKYTDLQAAVALAQLSRFGDRLAHFRKRDAWYREFLADCPGILLPDEPNFDGEVLQWTDILCGDRAAVQSALQARRIDSRAFWLPLHRQEPYRSEDRDFPNAIDISARGMWLPSAFDLTNEEAKAVARVVRAAVAAA